MGWDPCFFRVRPEWLARGFPIKTDDDEFALAAEPGFAERAAAHVRAFRADLEPVPIIPLRDPRLERLVRVLWHTGDGALLGITVFADGHIGLDNHAGVEAICELYRHMIALDSRYVIFDPDDGQLYDEASFRTSVAARSITK